MDNYNNSLNEMEICFDAISNNESFARVAVAAFAAQTDPTLEEIEDIKTAVSEAVTNAIIHGYENTGGYDERGTVPRKSSLRNEGKVILKCSIVGDTIHITVKDYGKGIKDVNKAMEPLFTTKPELNRSGMGFAFMEAFMDELEVISAPNEGTIVRMTKKMGCGDWMSSEG